MNSLLSLLQPYPFERLNNLKSGISPVNLSSIALSIGEPKHLPPEFVLKQIAKNLDKISFYPKTQGTLELREAISQWCITRFNLAEGSLNANEHALPLNGTREGLFSFIQACITAGPNSKVLMPNPFYQIYEGATLLAGATPVFLNCLAQNNYQPDYHAIDEQTWRDCQLLILCSPGNPTGAVTSKETLIELIKLADKYDFVIASDECYSEIYFDEATPPTGLLEACASINRNDYQRCVVFHSLSKRSNLPGLRSGFIAGDKDIVKAFLSYRTYHGSAMPEPTQIASTLAWQDESHVIENRKIYTQKFKHTLDALDGCLNVRMPDAAFYLWPQLPDDDEKFCQRLFAEQNITVLPGQYLSRMSNSINPGKNHARLALVATEAECIEAALRIKQFVKKHY
jgi:N-succinyldiaminopimelate aminotransferase